jgi:hypothetical protein
MAPGRARSRQGRRIRLLSRSSTRAVSDEVDIQKFSFPQAKKLYFLVFRLAATELAAWLEG